MRFRRIGKSGVIVSEIGFGVWTITTGWWGKYEKSQAIRLLRKALEWGITFYDTADTYADGAGEEILKEAFDDNIKNITIATKFGYNFYEHSKDRKGHSEIPQRWDIEYFQKALENSLRRLGREWIDLYQLHNPKMDAINNDELFEELFKQKKKGTIRAIGVALGPAIGWYEEGRVSILTRNVDAVQTVYNMLEQTPGKYFLQMCKQTGSSILVRVPHCSGLLEGKYNENTEFKPDDHRSFRPKEWLTKGLKIVEDLSRYTKTNRTLGQLALQYILEEECIASVLPNIYDEEQMREFVEYEDAPALSEREKHELNMYLLRNQIS
ncbi:MAG: aldo/keto reductase [Planctomycetota bacterium]